MRLKIVRSTVRSRPQPHILSCYRFCRVIDLKALLDVYIIHFTPLENRKSKLEQELSSFTDVEWITEALINESKVTFSSEEKVLGIAPRLIGMDLGINSRSLTRSRRKAKLEGFKLLLASWIHPRGEELVASAIQLREKLPLGVLDNLKQHLVALERASKSDKPFTLILEDDALPRTEALKEIEDFLTTTKSKNLILFCGDGAGLKRTKSDEPGDKYGIFPTKTFCTRTAVATLYSKDVILAVHQVINEYGVPDWMPIDYLLQVAARKTRVKTFWQEPAWFGQGSESGEFKSSLR